MATGYFQGFFLVLQFYSYLIGIKYRLHYSNQVKKKLFNKKLICLKNIYKKAFLGQNVDAT